MFPLKKKIKYKKHKKQKFIYKKYKNNLIFFIELKIIY